MKTKTLVLSIGFICCISLVSANVINVPVDQSTIQAGINSAVNSDTVLVQPGTYLENINFIGKNITVGSLFLTTRDTTYISSTIIDGNGTNSVVKIESGEDATAILCGFKLTNGYASNGGGIYCNGSSPTIKNVAISSNSATFEGGGIYCNGSSPKLENVTIADNSAGSNGGGIYCNNSSSNPVLINSILWNDLPQEIYLQSGSVTASFSDIEGGWTGVANIDDDPLFTGDYHLQNISPCIDAGDPVSPLDPDSTIADMGAYYFHQYFGPVWHISPTGSDLAGNGSLDFPFATINRGIWATVDSDTVLAQPGTYYENVNFAGRLITVGSLFLVTQDTTYISTTIINGNNSGIVVAFENDEDELAILTGFTITNGNTAHGGGIRCATASPRLENLIIKNNSVLNFGGGIYCGYADPIIKNVVISNNSADMYGGAIATWYSHPVLTNVTISGNSGVNFADGIYCAWNSSLSFTNSIVWNNFPDDIYIVSGGAVYASYSDIPEIIGVGNIVANPLFTGDYHLQFGSPCIDAGDPASPFDPDGTIVDMGAYCFSQFVEREISLKAFLQGPFYNTDMNIDLNFAGLIPTNQPYSISPWNYSGTESVSSIPANVVDWVLIELRDAPDANSATATTIIEQHAAFLRNDGSVVDLDGLNNLQISSTINQQLFVVIRHRNHLDIMSAFPLLQLEGVYSYDFTIMDRAYGTNATISIGGGSFGMYSGDANADGYIDDLDKSSIWILEAGNLDYLSSDLNLDSQSNNVDKDEFWLMNRGEDCQVPE